MVGDGSYGVDLEERVLDYAMDTFRLLRPEEVGGWRLDFGFEEFGG